MIMIPGYPSPEMRLAAILQKVKVLEFGHDSSMPGPGPPFISDLLR
jgi:hypothetical protein